jgi:hypothetical protein
MQPAAFVADRESRKVMSGLETKRLGQANMHGAKDSKVGRKEWKATNPFQKLCLANPS